MHESRNLTQEEQVHESLKLLQEQQMHESSNSAQKYETNLHISADVVSRKAQIEEFMFLGLRMNCGVTRVKFEEYFGIPIEGIYGATLDTLKKQELLKISAGTITLTEKGQDLSNYVLAQFLL
jgi:oxygen-independent coproporphyrinogen-3 oxidase